LVLPISQRSTAEVFGPHHRVACDNLFETVMSDRSTDWNESLTSDLQDDEFVQEFVAAAIEEGVPLKAVLLKLAAANRAELAMALWESLNDQQRDAATDLSDEQKAELDRRWAEHLKNPESAIPWSEIRRKLCD